MSAADPAQTLCFTATFPPEDQFAPTAGELAGKMALSAGLPEEEAGALARQVEGAFSRALAEASGRSIQIDVGLCAGPSSVDITVKSGSDTLLSESRPRPR